MDQTKTESELLRKLSSEQPPKVWTEAESLFAWLCFLSFLYFLTFMIMFMVAIAAGAITLVDFVISSDSDLLLLTISLSMIPIVGVIMFVCGYLAYYSYHKHYRNAAEEQRNLKIMEGRNGSEPELPEESVTSKKVENQIYTDAEETEYRALYESLSRRFWVAVSAGIFIPPNCLLATFVFYLGIFSSSHPLVFIGVCSVLLMPSLLMVVIIFGAAFGYSRMQIRYNVYVRHQRLLVGFDYEDD